MNRINPILLFLALIIGGFGRIWGAWVNNESNDNHVEVVQRILAQQSISKVEDCWECFQPPAYYQFHASLSKITKAQSRRALIQQMQLVNAFLSFLAIWLIQLIVIRFYGRGNISKWALIFLLINPAFYGLSIQGTNDLSIMLLGTVCFYALLKAIDSRNQGWLFLIGLSSLSAALIKGSGLAVFLIFSTLLILVAIQQKKWLTLVIPILSLWILLSHSHYAQNHREYGNAFVTNLDKPPPPPLFENGNKDYVRPGITSVWNGFAIFRFGNMLQVPYNINLREEYPKHRTSFWSQLYGSFFDIQFLQHPYSWENKDPIRLNLTRVIFVLGLITIPIFAIGCYQSVRKGASFLIRNSRAYQVFIGFLIFMGMLIFNMKYAYDYRDFGCIKAIFMLPVLAPMLLIFINGLRSISHLKFSKPVAAILGSLLFLWIINVAVLVIQLTLINYGFIVIV